jgi:hypothetical protein
VIKDLIYVFFNFGVLVIFRQQYVVNAAYCACNNAKFAPNLLAEFAEVLRRISKILAQNTRRRCLTKEFKDIKTVLSSGGFHHLRTVINVSGSVQSSV